MFIKVFYKHSIIADDNDRRSNSTRSNHKIKEHHEVGGKDHGLGGQGPKPQKRGGPGGGSQKSPNFAHGGGKFGGGGFGGGPENRGHKT